jgi:hypothetical protein
MTVLHTIVLTVLIVSGTLPTAPSHAEESLIPAEMVYVGHGPSVMGADKDAPAESGNNSTAYDRRMNRPWSNEEALMNVTPL